MNSRLIVKVKESILSIIIGIIGNVCLLISILATIEGNDTIYSLFIMIGFGSCILSIVMSIVELFYVKKRFKCLLGFSIGSFPFVLILIIGLINVLRGVTV